MKIFINKKTIIVITVAFLTLTTYSYLLFFNIKTLQDNHYCVNINQQILSQTYTLLSQVKDIENVKLGYLITENDYYLELSKKVIPRINLQIDILHNLINNQEQYHNVKQLKILIGNSITNLKQIIHISHSNGYETALQFLKENQDRQLIETIINRIHKIETETLAELKTYSQKNHAIAQQITLLNFVTTCLGFIFLGIATWKINSDNYQSLKSEKLQEDNRMIWQQIIENLPITFWVYDFEKKKIIYISPEYQKISQRSCESLYENFLSFTENIYPDDRERIITIFEQDINANFDIEYRIVHPDTTIHWIRACGFLIHNQTEEMSRQAGFAQDITTQKQQEIEIIQLNETLEVRVQERTIQLEEVNRQLEAFTYSTSHDLQEPLQIIEGFTLTIIEDYGNQIPDCVLDYLQRILANSQRLQGLIENLLNYTQLINQEIPTEPVTLALVISESLIQLNAKIQERQAQIIVEEPLPLVIGNHLILVQVITNLLANAIKFVVPHQSPQIRVFATQKEEYIRLWIEDNGIGIPSEYKEEIFEVFKRLHGNDLYPGNGIGLAIVSKAMERMNGKCGAESQLNRGSRFWLELPLFREME
jgi:signal transduction histidine kinase/CHASE3 domain sensor protein